MKIKFNLEWKETNEKKESIIVQLQTKPSPIYDSKVCADVCRALHVGQYLLYLHFYLSSSWNQRRLELRYYFNNTGKWNATEHFYFSRLHFFIFYWRTILFSVICRILYHNFQDNIMLRPNPKIERYDIIFRST